MRILFFLSSAFLLLANCKPAQQSQLKQDEHKLYLPNVSRGGEKFHAFTARQVLTNQVPFDGDTASWKFAQENEDLGESVPLTEAAGNLNLDHGVHKQFVNRICVKEEVISGVSTCKYEPENGVIGEIQEAVNATVKGIEAFWSTQSKEYVMNYLSAFDKATHTDDGQTKIYIDYNASYILKVLDQTHWTPVDDNQYLVRDIFDPQIVTYDYEAIAIGDRLYRKFQNVPLDYLLRLGVPGYTYQCFGATGSQCAGLGMDQNLIRFLSANGDFGKVIGHGTPNVSTDAIFASYVQPYLIIEYSPLAGNWT